MNRILFGSPETWRAPERLRRFCAMIARNRDGSLTLQHSPWKRAARRLITAATLGWASTLAAHPPATAHTELVQLRPQAEPRLAGRVIDATGTGVGGARVVLQAADANQGVFKAVTDEKGAFSSRTSLPASMN